MWLFFGNQKRAGDWFHGARMEAWTAKGVLDRLDTAFNLDPEDGRFVQDRMVEQGADLLEWLTRRNAVLYVCGRRTTAGAGTRSALQRILADHAGLGPEATEERLAAWVAEGRLRFDLTD